MLAILDKYTTLYRNCVIQTTADLTFLTSFIFVILSCVLLTSYPYSPQSKASWLYESSAESQQLSKREGKITEIDGQGHGHWGVSSSPEAWMWHYQSKPREKTLTWLTFYRAVATPSCWGTVQPKRPSQRHSARAQEKQQCHSCQYVFPLFFLNE